MHVHISEKNMLSLYILNIYIQYKLYEYKYIHGNILKYIQYVCIYVLNNTYKYIHGNTWKYFQNIYCMCVLCIHNKYTHDHTCDLNEHKRRLFKKNTKKSYRSQTFEW